MEEQLYLILTTRHKDQLFGGDVHLFWEEIQVAIAQFYNVLDFIQKNKLKLNVIEGIFQFHIHTLAMIKNSLHKIFLMLNFRYFVVNQMRLKI